MTSPRKVGLLTPRPTAVPLSPMQRTLRARLAAYSLHSQGGTNTAAATAASQARFYREVTDAATARGEALTDAEIDRRMEYAMRSYMTKLSLKASRSRAETARQKAARDHGRADRAA